MRSVHARSGLVSLALLGLPGVALAKPGGGVSGELADLSSRVDSVETVLAETVARVGDHHTLLEVMQGADAEMQARIGDHHTLLEVMQGADAELQAKVADLGDTLTTSTAALAAETQANAEGVAANASAIAKLGREFGGLRDGYPSSSDLYRLLGDFYDHLSVLDSVRATLEKVGGAVSANTAGLANLGQTTSKGLEAVSSMVRGALAEIDALWAASDAATLDAFTVGALVTEEDGRGLYFLIRPQGSATAEDCADLKEGVADTYLYVPLGRDIAPWTGARPLLDACGSPAVTELGTPLSLLVDDGKQVPTKGQAVVDLGHLAQLTTGVSFTTPRAGHFGSDSFSAGHVRTGR